MIATTARFRYEDLEPALLRTAAAVRAAGLVPIVSPHPREREPVLRLAERLGIRAHPGRTREIVERGAAALLSEQSSGALLEAAVAGIPSAHLTGPEEYAFMPDLDIGLAGEDFLATALDRDLDAADDLQVRSRGWVAASGASAHARIEAALAGDLAQGIPSLDSWGAFS